eukprot:TRINITY_DN6667_c0_g1_i1.p1 TRINITY_DN6667_c0_g1~~TRINITY_DN6667_c0_g1_i1.p1  ORF type:complete len:371 (+),score=66.33 TRINITY_DN6667_c0_g1_i1:67-1179(+)
MAARPLVSVQKEKRQVPLPNVFLTPIRYDLVQFTHNKMKMNNRMPYGVTRRAGHGYSAESWGTGRAVARIPRVAGGGTHRSGQGAFGNMCRGGRMFAPTKVFRRWHRSVNVKIRRFATRSALAASAIPALVMARGSHIEEVPEIPLVVPNSVEALEKTRDAVKLLKDIGCEKDAAKGAATRGVRAGKGKRRNRRYVSRKGPILMVSKKCEAHRAFRNLHGVDVMNVNKLNLLKLCPGGHVGRMIIWTEDAFNQLNKLYPDTPPRQVDSKRVINSEEVQAVLRRKRPQKVKEVKRSKVLNPARKGERKQAKRQQLIREAINRDPTLSKAKLQKKRSEKKLRIAKLQGKVDKKGQKVKKPTQPKAGAKKSKK